MRYPLIGITLVALALTPAGAQSGHAAHMTSPAAAHAMKTPCPLHLQTLALSPRQQPVVDSLRADHEAVMAALPHSDTARKAMEATMRLTTAAVRALLDEPQRATFDAAVTAHGAEMAAMRAKGGHDCAECCKDCATHAHDAAAMKHEG